MQSQEHMIKLLHMLILHMKQTIKYGKQHSEYGVKGLNWLYIFLEGLTKLKVLGLIICIYF